MTAADSRTETAGAGEGTGRDAARWTIHPLLQEPRRKTALLIAVILGFSLGAAFSFEGLVYGLVALVVLVASLSRYWLPTRYLLDAQGVRIEHLGWQRRRSWDQFRRADVHADGVFLSPFLRASRLDSFRGCFLRFRKNRDEVMRLVREYVAAGPS